LKSFVKTLIKITGAVAEPLPRIRVFSRFQVCSSMMPLDWSSAESSALLKELRTRRELPRDWMPAQIGDSLKDIDTPALVVDLDKCERNLKQLMKAVAHSTVRVRPHAKTHKSAELARRQIDLGAVGVCCQKLGEAEAMLAGGIQDVLITSPIVGDAKLIRLSKVARSYAPARIGICIDQAETARRLTHICQAEGARLDVYIDIDVGQTGCGLSTNDEVVALGRYLVQQAHLRFRGIQAYAGPAQHRRGIPERRAAAQAAAERAGSARDALITAGIGCEVITGGGTGTLPYDIDSGVFTEVQPGSYLFMDTDYAKNEPDPRHALAFEHALFVLSSVISTQGEKATLDAGMKSFSTDCGPAQPAFTGWSIRSVTDEHTVLVRDYVRTSIKVGDKALLVPGHCDPTVNLHDWLVLTRAGRVEAIWPVEARGRSY
jgi:D-serine deaminase-like pyridoxal phosphate-dependent protein